MIVLLILSAVVTFSSSSQIKVTKDIIPIPKKSQQEYHINQGEETVIINYMQKHTTIGIELVPQDDICQAIQHSILFENYFNKEQEILPRTDFHQFYSPNDFSPHANDPTYFLNNPILVNMVHIQNGFAGVTSDHRVMIFNVTEDPDSFRGFAVSKLAEINYSALMPKVYEQQAPQLAYEPVNDNLFIIYPGQIIVGKTRLNLSNLRVENSSQGGLSNDRNYIGNVRVSNGHLFVPQGDDGLDIYYVFPSGDLEHKATVDSQSLYGDQSKIYITDCAIGGEQGQYLYVLDRNRGVSLFDISDQNGMAFNIHKVDQFGLIPVKYGIIIKEWNNTNLFILSQRGHDSYVQEYALVKSLDWYLLRTHYLKGKYFDLDVTNKFAVLRGVDAHRIIYHSILSDFQQTSEELYIDTKDEEKQSKLDEEYLYLPKLMSLEFFNKDFGVGDPKSWHHNQKHQFLFGMTTHNVVELHYFMLNPHVVCKAKYRWQIGMQKDYKLQINSTNCPQKEELMQKNVIASPYLYMCVFEEDFSLTVQQGSGSKFTPHELFSIITGLACLMAVLIIVLVHLYRRFKRQKVQLSDEISGFENRGYSVDTSQQPPVEV